MSESKKPFNYGGQAVIEGVMMRGSRALSVAVRNPEGNIVIHTEPLNQTVYNGKWMKRPFFRGLVLLWDALGLGIKALMFSADVALDEEDEKAAKDKSSNDDSAESDSEPNPDYTPSQAFSTPCRLAPCC